MNSMTIYNQLPLINNFESYKNYVFNLPNLTEEEERALLEKFKLENCLVTAQKLIVSQLKTVLHVARKYRNYGISEEDLVQEGNIGLMKAVKNYDITHKVRLYTYALLWIKAEIQSYILKNWKIVKVGSTKNFKKLFFNFRQLQKEMLELGISKNKIIENISLELDIDADEVREVANYFSAEDASLDDDDENSPKYYLTDQSNPENDTMLVHDGQLREKMLLDTMIQLSDRQQEVIQMRYFDEDKKTHKEIASIIGVSSERVRQIEVESLLKMKNILLKQYNVKEVF